MSHNIRIIAWNKQTQGVSNMSIINRLLFKLSSYLRCRVIRGPEQQAYLERYHLLHLPFGIHVYLHRFVASDPGRALHNHPWRSALSLVLSGQYDETRLGSGKYNNQLIKRSIHAGSFNFISGKIYHRINLNKDEEAWTLFIHTASHRSWGFLDTEDRQFSYTDHRHSIKADSNPLWWRTALRPCNQPGMRSLLNTK